jgi:peptide/nickel transport system ATP-binding protein/oligopeptide transport system ATP-binding protein
MLSEDQPLLQVRDLRKSFALPRKPSELLRKPQRLVAVDGVSLAVDAGRTLAVVGESGSGKSTLASCIIRLVEPDSGTITFRGSDVLAASGDAQKDLRRRIQMVFQDPYSALNPSMRIGRAVVEPALVHGLHPKRDLDRLARELLETVGLSAALMNRRPAALSGGQRQRVTIARALAAQPEVLIADEAVSALDVSIQAQILNLLMDLQDRLGLAIVFITHQLSLVGKIADEVAVMYRGRVVERGPTGSVFSNPAHPYTATLLEAQPGIHRRGARRQAVRAEVSSALDLSRGCRFRDRCPLAEELCGRVDPPAEEISPGHLSWCHRPVGAAHARSERQSPDAVTTC